jgi:uncharacterized membrane protein YozB (DUF420 family)
VSKRSRWNENSTSGSRRSLVEIMLIRFLILFVFSFSYLLIGSLILNRKNPNDHSGDMGIANAFVWYFLVLIPGGIMTVVGVLGVIGSLIWSLVET